jgi:hypothetical protein
MAGWEYFGNPVTPAGHRSTVDVVKLSSSNFCTFRLHVWFCRPIYLVLAKHSLWTFPLLTVRCGGSLRYFLCRFYCLRPQSLLSHCWQGRLRHIGLGDVSPTTKLGVDKVDEIGGCSLVELNVSRVLLAIHGSAVTFQHVCKSSQ